MSGKSKTGKAKKGDQKKLDELKKKLAIQEQKLAAAQKKNKQEAKQIAQEKKKISNQWKELKNAQKKLEADKAFLKKTKSTPSKAPRSSVGGKQAQQDILDWKAKYNAEGKRAREYKRLVDQLTAELKVVKSKLKNANAKKVVADDPRIKHMMNQIKILKRKIRMLIKELNKKRRWFQRTIKQFKTNQEYWLKQQRDAAGKKIVIKYVFLDDITKIKQYRDKKSKGKYRRKIRVRAKGGGEIVLNNIDIEVYDTDEEDISFSKKKKGKGKGKGAKGKKGKKNKNEEDGDDLDAFMAEITQSLQQARENVDAEDDVKSVESDEEDSDDDAFLDAELAATGPNLLSVPGGRAQSISPHDSAALESRIVYLRHEMEARTADLQALKKILTGADENTAQDVEQLLENVRQRQNEMVDNMQTRIQADIDTSETEEANNQWQLWLNKFSDSINASAEQFNRLCETYDFFLRELDARTNELQTVNEIYYTFEDEAQKDEPEEAVVESESKEDEADALIDDDEEENDGKDEPDGKDEVEDNKKQEERKVKETVSFGSLQESLGVRHSVFEKELVVVEDSSVEDEIKEEEEEDDDEAKNQKTLQTNQKKVDDICQSFLKCNQTWKIKVGECSADYQQAVEVKQLLVKQMLETNQELQSLMSKVELVPSRNVFDA